MPSVIAKIEYQAEHALLLVTSTSGRTYQYFLVRPHVAEELQQAPSKGSDINRHIRDR